MARAKYNHRGSFVENKSKAAKVIELGSGDLVEFRYKPKNKKIRISDAKPFILFLGRDTKTDLIHAVNLNYLDKSRVEKLFSFLNSKQVLGEALMSDEDIKKASFIEIDTIRLGGWT